MVAPLDSTLTAIRKKVRRLTASPSEATLSTPDLDQYINTFYQQDFPYAVKTDQMRSVYTFFTQPNIDRYPLDVNFNQGIRSPIYVEGVEGLFFKDRKQFYDMWPRWPTLFTPASGNGTTVNFSFTIQGPFLSKEVVVGTVDANGAAVSINDDGNGNLYLQTPNAQTSVPIITSTLPGMKNLNTGNPGQNNLTNVGTVNYVTGQFAIAFPVAPGSGQTITVWVSQYQTGRPYALLFWNNEFTIRPVPSRVHKVEVETYLTPVQFLEISSNPIVNQWWQCIAIGSSIKILEDRNDFDGVQALSLIYDRQVGLVLERQGVEEIHQRNTTIYNGNLANQGWNNGFYGGWWY